MADFFLVCAAFILSVNLRYEFTIPIEITDLMSLNNFLGFILIKFSMFKFFGLYRGMWRYTSIYDMINIIKANTVASFFIVLFMSFFYGFYGISRAIFVLDFSICVVFICCSRIGIRLFFSHVINSLRNNKNKNRPYKQIILIGAGDTGQLILRQILNNSRSRMRVVAFLDDDIKKNNSKIHNVPIIGPVKNLSTINFPYDEIYICAPSATREQMEKIINECKKTGRRFKTLPSFSELLNRDVNVSQFRDVSIVDLLGREEVHLDKTSIKKFIKGKRVAITGAGGSIGSELVRQCIKFKPSILLMIDNSELNLFKIEMELDSRSKDTLIKLEVMTQK